MFLDIKVGLVVAEGVNHVQGFVGVTWDNWIKRHPDIGGVGDDREATLKVKIAGVVQRIGRGHGHNQAHPV